MYEQLNFPWFNKIRLIEKEVTLDIERIKAMLHSADRIQALLTRREAIETDCKKLSDERAEIDLELMQLTGQVPAPVRTGKRKCSVCGSDGHSKRTCPQARAA